MNLIFSGERQRTKLSRRRADDDDLTQYIVSYTVYYSMETVLLDDTLGDIFVFIREQAFPAIPTNVTSVDVDEEYMEEEAVEALETQGKAVPSVRARTEHVLQLDGLLLVLFGALIIGKSSSRIAM